MVYVVLTNSVLLVISETRHCLFFFNLCLVCGLIAPSVGHKNFICAASNFAVSHFVNIQTFKPCSSCGVMNSCRISFMCMGVSLKASQRLDKS
jgi:hypothetical protein